MRIGVPKERAEGERRVAVHPDSVRKLVKRGHEVVPSASVALIVAGAKFASPSLR